MLKRRFQIFSYISITIDPWTTEVSPAKGHIHVDFFQKNTYCTIIVVSLPYYFLSIFFPLAYCTVRIQYIIQTMCWSTVYVMTTVNSSLLVNLGGVKSYKQIFDCMVGGGVTPSSFKGQLCWQVQGNTLSSVYFSRKSC